MRIVYNHFLDARNQDSRNSDRVEVVILIVYLDVASPDERRIRRIRHKLQRWQISHLIEVFLPTCAAPWAVPRPLVAGSWVRRWCVMGAVADARVCVFGEERAQRSATWVGW